MNWANISKKNKKNLERCKTVSEVMQNALGYEKVGQAFNSWEKAFSIKN